MVRKKFRPMLDVLEAKIALDGTVIQPPVGITTPIETVTPSPASAAQLQEMQNLTNSIMSNSTQNGVAPFRVTVPGVGNSDGVTSSVPALPGTSNSTGVTSAVSGVAGSSNPGTVGGSTPVVTNRAPAPYDVVPTSIPNSAVVLGSYGGPSPVSLQAVLVAVPKSLYPQLGPVRYT